LNKRYVRDLMVFDKIVTVLKAVQALTPDHSKQPLNYMHITNKSVGYLINFGPLDAAEWKRYILSKYIPTSS
jgi:GxxExxY protein